MSRRGPKVLVLHNHPALPPDHPDFTSEADVVRVARAVVAALRSEQIRAWTLAAKPPVDRLVRRIERQKPSLIFNLIEGFGGRSGGESRITALLELLEVPYTGCPPETQALCRDKGLTKRLLRGAGLPTAPFFVLGSGPIELHGLDFPAIVKPAREDASLGIDQGSVVSSNDALIARVDVLRARFGPDVLVESYLPGPEYNVGVLALPEPVPLAIAEVVYDLPAGAWPILTYEAKWDAGSAADLASPVRCPASIEPTLSDALESLALEAFRVTGCRDVARVDFRLDGEGRPMILEVNPNPDLGADAGWARALAVSGRSYSTTLAALARQAWERGPRR